MAETQRPPTSVEHFDASAAKYERSTGKCTRELARALLDLPQLQDLCSAEAVVLDNACGTAIVADEIINRCRQQNTSIPEIHAVDPAPNMVDLARAKLAALDATHRCTAAVMPGEKLAFGDAAFSHSITNLGILFFNDGAAGARELHRTLRPGGVAVVTSWADVGYLRGVIQPAHKAARPDDAPFDLPIPKAWLEPAHVERCLRDDGGFAAVEMLERVVHYGAATRDELRQMSLDTFQALWKDWTGEELERFRGAMAECIERVAEPYTMVDGTPGVGIRMRAIVAVCRK
ncbi:hypothetical protein TPAR_08100 [Tolypocladium paradoxum]|uniref:Methyltransferase domain-containing protein n=1 Tax=Tolypocladium paradoxum TaxID=94208 RepID=A0A2S4KNC4_9HYPO|nr:hypothetical protein TPAR_08100 [Tolypocladium paradoxum]